MSLKTFHVIFIVCSIILSVGFGYWAFMNFQNTQSLAYLFTMIGSILFAFGLVIYEMSFLKRIKN